MTKMNWIEEFELRQKEYMEKLNKPNILLVGRTGAGKSSLINKMFGKNIAESGVGKPISKGFVKKTSEGSIVTIYDSEGYEISDDEGKAFTDRTIKFIQDRPKDDLEKIHLVWFVVPANSNRIPDFEVDLFKKIEQTGTPVALIFSKCDETNPDDLTAMIKRIYPSSSYEMAKDTADSPFFTVAINLENNPEIEKSFNLDSLTAWSISELPDIVAEAFIAAQNVSLKEKQDKANKIILQHTGGNVAVAFTPIPFSDAPILITSQIAMLTRIINIYGIQGFSLTQFMQTSGAGLIVSSLGKSIVRQALKFIPAIGTIIGGLINATVASAITYAMGKATSELLYRFLQAKLDEKLQIDDDFQQYFTSNFKDLFTSFFKEKMKK